VALSTSVKKTQLTRHTGAELEGLDLLKMTDGDVQELLQLIAERGVVVVRDQPMSVQEQIEFGRRLGELHTHPAYASNETPEALHIYGDANSKMVPGEGWHSDVSCDERPPGVSMLRIETCPSVGGDTMFSNMYSLWEEFSEPFKAFIRPLSAIHAGDLPWRGQYKSTDAREYPTNVHPMVRTHPLTGRDALYVNAGFTDRVKGLRRPEGDALLKFLFDQVALGVEHMCRVRWEPNTVTFWDNRCVQHHACWDYFPETREGWRVTTVGERPYRVD